MARATDKDSQDKIVMLQIMEAIKSIKYGNVQITIQDSRVVQIDKTEKLRMPRPRECIC